MFVLLALAALLAAPVWAIAVVVKLLSVVLRGRRPDRRVGLLRWGAGMAAAAGIILLAMALGAVEMSDHESRSGTDSSPAPACRDAAPHLVEHLVGHRASYLPPSFDCVLDDGTTYPSSGATCGSTGSSSCARRSPDCWQWGPGTGPLGRRACRTSRRRGDPAPVARSSSDGSIAVGVVVTTTKRPGGEIPSGAFWLVAGCAPGRTRTCGQALRRRLLYPLSYGAGCGGLSSWCPGGGLSVTLPETRIGLPHPCPCRLASVARCGGSVKRS